MLQFYTHDSYRNGDSAAVSPAFAASACAKPGGNSALFMAEFQVVRHTKNLRHLVGRYPCKVFVHFVFYGSLKRYMPVIDNNVDRGNSLNGVPFKSDRTIDGIKLPAPDCVVKGQRREHLNVVYHFLDAFNQLNRTLRIDFQIRPDNLALQNHRVAVLDFEFQVVENRVIGERDQFFPYRFLQVSHA